jgi:general secretion pathway protein D
MKRRCRTWLAITIGLSVAASAPAQDTSTVRPAEQGVLIDFQDADLRLVITALAEAGGLNVTYAELPARRITLRLRQPLARDAVLPLLRSIAQSNGLRVIEEAGLIRLEGTGESAVQGRDTSAAGQSQAQVRLFVHRLRHAQAARIAATLQAVFNQRSTPTDASGIRRPPLSEQLREQRVPTFTPDTSRVAAPAAAPTSPAVLPAQLSGEIQIVPDETTNSLLIRATAEDYEILQQAVQALDLRPRQVLIEVLIAEVRKNRDLEIGVSGVVTHTREGETEPSTSAELKGSTITDFVLKVSRSGDLDVNLALAALATRGDVHILSRPVLFAQNNQEARILVGSERPFVQVFRTLPTDAGVRDQVVQYRDVGTSLTIIPTVNPDDYVNLQVLQEVSTATSELQFGAPVISTREASTLLFLRDGQTGVIGGLIDRQEDRTRSGIPILSSLPVLGALFGSTRNASTTSELFLFVTPHLVRTDEELDEIRRRIERDAKLLRESRLLKPPPDSGRPPEHP